MRTERLHPLRWSIKLSSARCELCGRECSMVRLEVRGDDSRWCCPEHGLESDMQHPISPQVYAALMVRRVRFAPANDNARRRQSRAAKAAA